MNKEESISDVILLSKTYSCPSLDLIRRDIKSAVLKNRYDWQIARIGEKGNIAFE